MPRRPPPGRTLCAVVRLSYRYFLLCRCTLAAVGALLYRQRNTLIACSTLPEIYNNETRALSLSVCVSRGDRRFDTRTAAPMFAGHTALPSVYLLPCGSSNCLFHTCSAAGLCSVLGHLVAIAFAWVYEYHILLPRSTQQSRQLQLTNRGCLYGCRVESTNHGLSGKSLLFIVAVCVRNVIAKSP